MGIYLNPDNYLFRENLNGDIYVDKSMLIEKLNNIIDKPDKYLCVSRPRRFGKTMMTNLITAYYSTGCDSRELFSNLKIAQTPDWDRYLNKFNVIKFDVIGSYADVKDKSELTEYMCKPIIKELMKEFPDAEIDDSDSFRTAILKVYSATGEQFILIMDEYDLMVREKVSKKAFDNYLEFLNGLFKSASLRSALHLAYLTGILPIVRDKIQSKLNEFTEYSMTDAGCLRGFIGFTEDEVQALCESHNMDFKECKRWYNGYKIGSADSIYNPRSVVKAMTDHCFGDYWTKTGSYESIKDYVKLNFDGTKYDIVSMIGGKSVKVNVTSFLNTMTDFSTKDDVFTYLIHIGYLAYDTVKKVCWIPNNEIRSEWINAIAAIPQYSNVVAMVKESEDLLNSTFECDCDAVAAALDKAHIIATNPKTYNNEGAFQAAICLAYFYAYEFYTVIQELPTGKGYADVVFLPVHPGQGKPAIVVELKMDKTANTALDQIKNKKYGTALEHYNGDMLLVGINYDSKTKEHKCIIEEFVK